MYLSVRLATLGVDSVVLPHTFGGWSSLLITETKDCFSWEQVPVFWNTANTLLWYPLGQNIPNQHFLHLLHTARFSAPLRVNEREWVCVHNSVSVPPEPKFHYFMKNKWILLWAYFTEWTIGISGPLRGFFLKDVNAYKHWTVSVRLKAVQWNWWEMW